MQPKHRAPTTPGEILLEEFLKPRKMTQGDFAQKLGVPIQRINAIVNGRRAVTAETALLLAKELKTSPEFWMNLQVKVDLWKARNAKAA
jgi:addiction module HigA family antidote